MLFVLIKGQITNPAYPTIKKKKCKKTILPWQHPSLLILTRLIRPRIRCWLLPALCSALLSFPKSPSAAPLLPAVCLFLHCLAVLSCVCMSMSVASQLHIALLLPSQEPAELQVNSQHLRLWAPLITSTGGPSTTPLAVSRPLS